MKIADHGPDVASLRALIDSLPALIHTGRPVGYLDFFNRRWLEFVGLRLEDLEGWKWTAVVHPDDVAGLVARWRACLASGEPFGFEARVRRADGEYRWMLHQKVALRDESGEIAKWYGSSVEIEDRKRAEFKIRAQEAELRRVIDAIPTLAWCNLTDGSNEFLNKTWHEYTGLSPENSHGWGWQAAFHPEDLPPLIEKWKAMLVSGEPGEIEARLRRHDGAYRWFLIRAEPFRDEAGKIVRWYGTSTDIEDLKRAESKLRQDGRELEMIADGASLKDVLNHICSSIDVQVSPSVTTVLLMDPDGKRLWQSAGLLVPREWVSVISPVPVAVEAGLCGTAAFLKARVIVTGVATDPNWPDRYRDLAIRNGIRAAWSQPILTKDNQVLGTFALYCSESRVPTDADLALIEGAGCIALIAIERQRSQEALRKALDEIRESEAEL